MSWELTNLQEVTSKIGDGLHGTPKYDKNGGYYFINGNNLRQGRVEIKEDTKKIDFQQYQKIKKDLNNQTIFVAINGTLGNIGIYNGEKIALGKSACYLNINQNVEKLFIRYVLENGTFQSYAQRFATGATIKNLGLKAIRNYEFLLPPLKTQKRIADILSAYDDLIENNLKRIKLLEQAAQNIYKEWFVNLRFPGHENTPINEETGLPEGWGIKKLSESIDFKEGPGLRNWQYRTEGIPFLNIRMMNSGDLKFSSVKYLEVEEVDNRYKHFLLNEFDHIISTSGTLGKVVTIRKAHLPLCLNTSIIRLRPIQSGIGKWYIKRKVSSREFVDEMKSFATGSAQLNFGPKHLNMMNIMVPNEELSEQYERLTNPLELKILALLDYNQKLKAARDILLPRLMNRTIEV
tara:strand:- start:3314 stop:4531 length:1218 start_codon:yes stop_codon:yes gene_type:complete